MTEELLDDGTRTQALDAEKDVRVTRPLSIVRVDKPRRYLLVGFTELGRAVAAQLQWQNPRSEIVGYLGDENHPQVIGNACDLVTIARRKFVDQVIVTTSMSDAITTAVGEARRDHIEVVVVPERRQTRSGFASGGPERTASIAGFPAIVVHREARSAIPLALKRSIDLIGATVGLVLLLPLFLLLAVLVKLDSWNGPIFYAHTRVGRKGRRFTCYKFRTMIPQAAALKNDLRHLNELGNGFFFKMRADPRLTRVGGHLRLYSLDELPQLFNVLRGSMSLVGPRPSPVDDFEMYETCHLRRLDVKPGITGLWQIVGRKDPAFDRAMEVDRDYVNRWSVWLDLAILLKTIPVLADGE